MQFSFEAIGTHWQIEWPLFAKSLTQKKVKDLVLARISEFDKSYSRFRGDSLVTKMSSTPGTYELPNDAKPLMDLYQDLYQKTQGLMTPLIGNTLSDAGYDASYSLVPKKTLTKPPQWEEALFYNFPKLEIKIPVLLDFGAAGKGYLIDIVGSLLTSIGISEFTIDAGGDILHHANDNELRIGLEHPLNENQVIGVVTLKNGSLCGSAGNRRVWKNYHHILSPKTLAPVRDVLAVWTQAETALNADGLATCLFLVDPQSLTQYYKFEYLIVYSDYTINKSKNFPAEIFTT